MSANPDGPKRVEEYLASRNVACEIFRFPKSTRTAKEAAVAIGCTVSQIAKSIVFRGGESGEPILVVASGTNRVSEQKVAAIVGESLQRADADFVREQTGFAIGGVPPAGHRKPIRTVLDLDLAEHEEIWAAAGAPNAVFKTTFEILDLITGGDKAVIA